jgi:hypothetical protein
LTQRSFEWLWRALRRAVTHCHQRRTLPPLLDDATGWATALTPQQALSHIGSPFAAATEPPLPRRDAPHDRRNPPHRAPAALPHAA